MSTGPIVFFDGTCGLCSRAVRFIATRDRAARFRFAPLQGAVARRLLPPAGIDPTRLDSLVLWHDGRASTRSDAAIAIVRHLDGAWPLLASLRFLPRRLRDAAYDFVARRRFRWFGRTDACALPAPELRERLLDD